MRVGERWPREYVRSYWCLEYCTCRDSRHHADFISVITACQSGVLGTSVKLFYTLLSALNVFFFCISILGQHFLQGAFTPTD